MHTHRFTSGLSAASSPPVASAPADDRQPQARPFVLVVDDEAIIADTLVQILNRDGFDAQACYSGFEAIEAARRLQPMTVLSDVAMPFVDGIQAAIAIRECCPSTRIVLFSGQSTTLEILDRARALGHDFELLPKPIHPRVLLARLRAN